MPADTSMNDRQKLKSLNRLSGLTRTAEELIHKNTRKGEEVDLLLEAMQAFKEGKLAGIWCAPKSHQPKNVVSVFDLEIRNIALPEDDKRMLMKRGVRHLGELFYVWFDPRSAIANERGERIMAFVSRTFNIPIGADPVKLGWKPCYWGDLSFMTELNMLVLERCPTPPAPDWDRYVQLGSYRRGREGIDVFNRRGVARRIHSWGKVHFVGELLAFYDKYVPGPKSHCPPGKRGMGDLDSIARDLRDVHSHLWAAARIPTDWVAPDWQGELWQKELAEIGREAMTIREIEERRSTDQKSAERARVEAQQVRRAELAQIPSSELLNRRLDECDFGVRTANCLQNAGIETFGQLVAMAEADMLKTKNFGRKSLNEVKEKLNEYGLRLGMTAADFDKNSNPICTVT
jgi:hypothetical protein